MINLSAETRARRLNKAVDPYKEISVRAYNLILIGTVLYGLAINALLCRESIVYFMYERVHPAVFFIVYIVCVIAGVLIANKSDNPVISFLGYNLIVVPMGIVVGEAVILGGYSPSVVWHACITTAGMTVIMAAAGLLFPQFSVFCFRSSFRASTWWSRSLQPFSFPCISATMSTVRSSFRAPWTMQLTVPLTSMLILSICS